ncbi:MAG: 6-carboxyhexanoate--CoA ligase [Desulfuromonas sp.]|uniref:6-carboxyhexanoate--CoA ligase n=1 Tax=Desulfuromonas sp. TaxID=892 RepID=UPI000CBEC655|nr:6-carboxyhexanoate--CoA ligase [Desulfuromonas sp.]PLX82870.1 MAG: 6-carboxyhexanoate--CoA ligase [Desulfuromonas sp.]
MTQDLYSIRMHATRGGAHLSGAEGLAPSGDLECLAAALVRRALEHPRGRADAVRLSVDAVEAAEVRTGRLPDLTTIVVEDWRQGREAALYFLAEAGVSTGAAEQAVATLAAGAAPGGESMRGAMLVDAHSGDRLEPDPARGVRASRMGLSRDAERQLRRVLGPLGLDNEHVREAMVLAAKVLSAPGIVAELCWSDDPDYTAGYVASPALGYVRFPHLKPKGEERGGRAIFLRREGSGLDAVIASLESSALLVDGMGEFHPQRVWKG